MNSVSMDPFLIGAVAICVVMAIVSSLRFKSRGPSAYIMGVAFAVLGAGMLLIYRRGSLILILVCGILLVLLLGADFAARSVHAAKKDQA